MMKKKEHKKILESIKSTTNYPEVLPSEIIRNVHVDRAGQEYEIDAPKDHYLKKIPNIKFNKPDVDETNYDKDNLKTIQQMLSSNLPANITRGIEFDKMKAWREFDPKEITERAKFLNDYYKGLEQQVSTSVEPSLIPRESYTEKLKELENLKKEHDTTSQSKSKELEELQKKQNTTSQGKTTVENELKKLKEKNLIGNRFLGTGLGAGLGGMLGYNFLGKDWLSTLLGAGAGGLGGYYLQPLLEQYFKENK